MHHMHAVRCGEHAVCICPSCWNHSPSLCPLAEISFERFIIINGQASHDHVVTVLPDMRAWVPLPSRPCVGLPSIGNEAIVEKELDQPVAAIRPYARKS